MAKHLMPEAADLPGFKYRTHMAASIDIGDERPLSQVNRGCTHDTEGSFGGDEPELTRYDSKVASCHALIGRTPEQGIVGMVGLNYTAYTPGNNKIAEVSINLELSGFQKDDYTDYQYQAAAAYYRWAVSEGCPIPAEFVGTEGNDRPGHMGHQHVLNPNWPDRSTTKYGGVSGHTDPGPRFKWGYLIQLLKGGTVVPEKEELPYGAEFDSNGLLWFVVAGKRIPIATGFLEYYLTLGRNVPISKSSDRIFNAVRLFGLPVEAEHTDPDKIGRQVFERYRMAYNKNNPYGWELYGEFVS